MRKYYGASTGFLDLLFNALIGFVGMFTIAFLLINPKTQSDANVKSKAEYIVIITWPVKMEDDVDAYLEDPLGNLVFFRRREQGLLHLDRDDLGHRNDTIDTPHGIIKFNDNREIITIRGIIPGEYVMNIHMFSKRSPKPTEVTVQIDRLNPSVKTVVLKTKVLHKDNDEATVCRFTLDKGGEVTEVNELPKSLIDTHKKTPTPSSITNPDSPPQPLDADPSDLGIPEEDE